MHLVGFVLRAVKPKWKSALKRPELLCLSANPRQWMRHVIGNTRQMVKKFKYLEWYSLEMEGGTSRMTRELMTQMQFCVSFIAPWSTKLEFSNTEKLSVFRPVYIPFLINCYESWVMTKGIQSQVKGAAVGFLRRFHGVTLCHKVWSCENFDALNSEPLLLRIKKSQLCWFSHVSRMSQERLSRRDLLAPNVSTRLPFDVHAHAGIMSVSSTSSTKGECLSGLTKCRNKNLSVC